MSPLLVLQNLAHNSTATLAVVKVNVLLVLIFQFFHIKITVIAMFLKRKCESSKCPSLPEVILISFPALMLCASPTKSYCAR